MKDIEKLFMIAALLFAVYFLTSTAEKFTVVDSKDNLQKTINDAYEAYVFGLRQFSS